MTTEQRARQWLEQNNDQDVGVLFSISARQLATFLDSAIAAERLACKLVAEKYQSPSFHPAGESFQIAQQVASEIAQAIGARE